MVLVIGIVNEVGSHFSANKKAGTKVVDPGGSGDRKLDWVIMTVLAGNPLSSTSEHVARLGWSARASLVLLIPSIVTILHTVAQQQGVDALLGVMTAADFFGRVAVVSDGFDVIDSVIQIIEETLRIDLLGVLDPFCNVTQLLLKSGQPQTRRSKSGFEILPKAAYWVRIISSSHVGYRQYGDNTAPHRAVSRT